MTSHDLRDVLNLPSDASGPRPSKKIKTSTARSNLKGLAREVQNLGGDNPIAIVPDVSVFKKRRYASRKPAARWDLRPFFNSAREDNGALILRHWRRQDEGQPPESNQESEPRSAGDTPSGEKQVQKMEDSAFAKYNVRVSVPQYSEDQYTSNLEHKDWTQEETDYLLELARDFDLRWPLIWDRYDFTPKPPPGEAQGDPSTAVVPAPRTRTMEELKARYYEVAAKMMAVQKPAQYMTRPEFELYEVMQTFDPAREKARKEFALNAMKKTESEAREEESLLLEIKRILARTERFNEERRELYNRLDYPSTDADINSFKSSAGLQALLQNLMNVDKSKKRKSLMGPGDGATPTTAVPGSAASETAPHRRESIAASAPGHRDSVNGTPATPVDPAPMANKKKGAQQPERRKLTPLEEQTYGLSYHDRLGSGPTFRYEKINKLFSHKSGQQQQRITNVLNELDIPARLAMPTAAVSAQFEHLWAAVIKLVDLRKASDRLDADIKVEEAKRAEIAKARAARGEADSTGGQKPSEEASAPQGTANGDTSSEDQPKEDKETTEGSKLTGQNDARPKQAAHNAEEAPKAASRPSTSNGGEANTSGAVDEVREEQTDGEKEKLVVRPGSSGAHKRSASVLSTASDKSAKRQKK